MRNLLALAAVGLAASTATRASDLARPVRVHVAGATGLTAKLSDAEKKGHKAQFEKPFEAAGAATERLVKEANSKHGKDRKKWPPDTLKAVEDSEQVLRDARTKFYWGAMDQEDVDGGVSDLTKELQKKDRLSLVQSPDEADLLVKVLGRLKTGMVGSAFCFEAAPGPGFDKALLDPALLSWGPPRNDADVLVLHPYSQEQPFWRIEVAGNGAGVKWGGYYGGLTVDKFVQTNAKLLDPALKPPAK